MLKKQSTALNWLYQNIGKKGISALLSGEWIVWEKDKLWGEWAIGETSEFIQKKHNGHTKTGQWTYLPHLEVISITFSDNDSENINYLVDNSKTIEDGFVFENYEEADDCVFVMNKDYFSEHYLQQITKTSFSGFIDEYKQIAQKQEETETRTIKSHLNIGCGSFGLLMLISLLFANGFIIGWITCIGVYVLLGEQLVKKQLIASRNENNFNTDYAWLLKNVNEKIEFYSRKKLWYGLIGFGFIMLIASIWWNMGL